MPGKSRKSDAHGEQAEDSKKASEDLERAARDMNKRTAQTDDEKTKEKIKERQAEKTDKHEAKPKARKEDEEGHKVQSADTRRAKLIESINEHEDYPGQSLATKDHDVIMRWAEERKARPATVEGTEHQRRPGVLRFDFPGYGDTLKTIAWDEWFETFDARDLTFIYQEHLKNGNQSNFFVLTSPHREDA